MKIVQALEESNILLKGITKTTKNETKNQKGGFLGMLSDTLGASLLGNILAEKEILRAAYVNKEGKGILRTSYGSERSSIFFLIPPHPLTNFKIQKFYQNEPIFNGVYSRDNLPNTIKDGAYVVNLDEYADVGTHCIALFNSNIEIIYLESLGVEHIPKEI